MKKENLAKTNLSKTSPKFKVRRLSLNFKDIDLEKGFRVEYFRKSLSFFRISFITVTLLYAAFGYLDFMSSKSLMEEFLFVRFIIVVPFLILIYIYSYHKYFSKTWQVLLSFSYVIAGTGITYMLIRNPNNIFYYGGMFLIFMAGYFFIKLRFVWATISGSIILITYNIGVVLAVKYTNVEFDYLIITNAFFISANIISSIASYNLELLERKDFYQKVLLSQTKDEIALINESLEEKVKNRTHLLNLRNKKLSSEISQRKEIEHKLILAKDKAEESDKLKSTFLATMSHELRTPLNSIIGFSEIIDMNIPHEDIVKYSKIINSSGNHLLKIVDDLFDVALIEAGETRIKNSQFVLSKAIHEVHDIIKIEKLDLGRDQVSLIQKIPPEFKDLKIFTDSAKLKQILLNLLKNALKFTHKGNITYGYTINGKDRNSTAEFFVKDTGIGISDHMQEVIFDTFRQVEDSDTRAYQGTGIGLSISRKLVNLLGGEIRVESELNMGSTFYFTIPFAEKPRSLPPDPKLSAVKNFKNKTFLIVEDDVLSYQFLETILSKNGSTILWAQDGEAAIKHFENGNQIDLVLMDIHMPRLNGLDATKKIKSLNPELPIIAQTAFAVAGDKEKALHAGCDDYISKPIKKNELISLMNKYLHN